MQVRRGQSRWYSGNAGETRVTPITTIRNDGSAQHGGSRDNLDAGRAGRQRPAQPGPTRPAHRHAARSAGAAGAGLQRALRPGPAARARADGPGAGHLRPGGARRGVRGAACAAPVPEVHGRPGPGDVPADRRALRRRRPPGLERRGRRNGPAQAGRRTARLRRAEGPDLRGLARQAAGGSAGGWREAAGAFGAAGTYCSVADICDEDSLARVRAYKQQLKAAAKNAATNPGTNTAANAGTTASTSPAPK